MQSHWRTTTLTTPPETKQLEQFELEQIEPLVQPSRRSVCMNASSVRGGFMEIHDRCDAPAGCANPQRRSQLEKEVAHSAESACSCVPGDSQLVDAAAHKGPTPAPLKWMERCFLREPLVELENGPATEVLARVRDFLRDHGPAKITKDGDQTGKASVTALVFVMIGNSLLQCTLRAKVYRTTRSGGGLSSVLEMTRRNGDAVAFGHFSGRVRAHLEGRSDEAPAPPLLPELAESPPAAPLDSQCVMLARGLGRDDCTQEQAEAAALAASLASTPAGLGMLLAALHEVHEILATLLVNAHVAIAYPTARAVAMLLASPPTGAAGEPAAEAWACLRAAAARVAAESAEPMVRAALG